MEAGTQATLTAALPDSGHPATITASSCIINVPEDKLIALQILSKMTLDEKVGQMFMARCPAQNAVEDVSNYHLGGYVLFARDTSTETAESLAEKINSYQQAAQIPLLISTDEEGGIVNRVSSYSQFRSTAFSSPQKLFRNGGMAAIIADTQEKSRLLLSLGINVNLAPVADVSTSSSDYIYSRSFGQDAAATAEYVTAVVETMEEHNIGAVLKHFPGYGNNGDTHTGIITDNRPLKSFYSSDLKPFHAGIEAGADFILISHNIISSFDAELPASLSPRLHQLLRYEMDFDGIIITDDLIMGAVAQKYNSEEVAVLAVLAGNDMLISSDHIRQIRAVIDAVQNGRISEDLIDNAVVRILRYKINAGLISWAYAPIPDPTTEQTNASSQNKQQ